MKKKKIAVLHAQIPFSRGGAELMAEALVQQLKNRGFDTELISIPFRWYPENGLYDNMLMWRMIDLREINGEKIDLVIPMKFPTYGVNHPNKVLWLMHQHRAAYDLFDNADHFGFGTIENGKRMREKVINYDRIALSEVNKIYSISENVAKRLKENNGLDAETLYHPPMLAGKYFCEEYGDFILSVGRLDPLKRIDLLIKSLEFCDKKVKIKIVGRGPEKEKLQKLAYDMGVQERVEFLDFVTDKQLLDLYAHAKAVYFAPVDEDYGYVTLEAFLSKKMIVTCNDTGGVLEFVKDQKSGIVCNVDEKQIGEVFNDIYANASVCKEFGENGYDVAKDISWDKVIDALTFNI